MVNPKSFRYRIFGLCLETAYRLRTPMTEATPEAESELLFECRLVGCRRDLSAADCLYLSPGMNRHGESAVQLYATSFAYIMRFPRVADFVLRPGEITCELCDPECDYLVEVCLLGHVLAYYLELTGVAAIHAGAVAVGEGAVLFVAERTSGKSTLVASLVAAGFPLLADDIGALEEREGMVNCRQGFPQLKLTPDQAIHFAGRAEGFPLVHPAFSKLSVPADAVGAVANTSLPVFGIYLLQRRADEEDGAHSAEIAMTPITAGETLIHLVRHSFLVELLDGHGRHSGFVQDNGEEKGRDENNLSASRFHRLTQIARAVPVKRLHYPSGYEYLPQVHAAILADLDLPSTVGEPHRA